MKNCSPHRKHQFLTALAAVALPAALTPLPATAAVMDIAKVVTSGDSAPDGNGTFSSLDNSFGVPRLNNAGQAAFTGNLFGSTNGANDDSGIFRGTTTAGSLITIIREGQATPSGDGTLNDLSGVDPTQNNSGQVAFLSDVVTLTSGRREIFRSDGTTVTEMIREGQALPISIGSFGTFSVPQINDAGQIATVSTLSGTLSTDSAGVFRSDGATITQIARKSQNAPGGSGGALGVLEQMSFNDLGQTAFISNPGFFNDGVFRGDGTVLDPLARGGDAAPNGGGGSVDTFTTFNALVFNDASQAAFSANTSSFLDPNAGVYRSDGSQVIQIVREDDLTPSGNGQFREFANNAINNAGQVAFEATSTGTAGGDTDNTGLFIGGGVTVTEAVREGDSIPDGLGSFERFITFAFNEAGQLAFFADIDLENGGTAFDSRGLFVFDGSDIIEIIRLEDSLFGSEVTALDFVGGEGTLDNARSGFNDLGQVAFRFELLNTIGGIAIADPGISNIPEPATLSLLMIGGLTLLRRRVV